LASGIKRTDSARGWKISKDKQTHKIDVVIALAMAGTESRQQHQQSPHEETGKHLK
jgi:hypothetical protein